MDLNIALLAGINPLMFSKVNFSEQQNVKEEPVKEVVDEEVKNERKRLLKRRRSTRIKYKRIRTLVNRTPTFQDVTQYFKDLDQISRARIADITSVTQQSLIDKFTDNSDSFIVTSFLTTARIFKFMRKENYYAEVKRMPNRYVTLSSKLITSLHVSKSRLYLAYLWGSSDDSKRAKKSYVEVRDLDGKLLLKPFFYDETILSIYSDQDFVYVKTHANIIFIHQQNFFNLFHYKIDFSNVAQSQLIDARVECADYDSKTELLILTACEKELILSEFDAHRHKVIQRIEMKGIQSIHPHKDKYIILRQGSVVDIAQIFDDNGHYEIRIISSLPLNKTVMDLKVSNLNLYFMEPREIGCISLNDLKTLWRKETSIADGSRMLIHEDHIAVLEGQKIKVVTKPT